MIEASSETSPDRSGQPPTPTLFTSMSDSTARHACSTASRLDPPAASIGHPATFAFCPKLQVLRIIGCVMVASSYVCNRNHCRRRETIQHGAHGCRPNLRARIARMTHHCRCCQYIRCFAVTVTPKLRRHGEVRKNWFHLLSVSAAWKDILTQRVSHAIDLHSLATDTIAHDVFAKWEMPFNE